LGFGSENQEEIPDINLMIKELSAYFPVEFLNRIDEILLFKHLELKDLKKIIEKKIIVKAQTIFNNQGIKVMFDDSLIKEVISQGYSKNFGARNLERTFENLVLRPVSSYLYSLQEKPTKLTLAYDNKLVIK